MRGIEFMSHTAEHVRVRIAPSPTGDPHVGTAYVTLFNYIFAKKHGGDLILRIEDTDQARVKTSSEQQIYDSLTWLGLKIDESPQKPGAYGPYRQSERKEIYLAHGNELLKSGHAYYCFCNSERLDRLRKEQREQGLTTKYDGHCRKIPKKEAEQKIAAGLSHVLRLKIADQGVVTFQDQIRGTIEISHNQLDDQVLIKSDGFPTYHLANVVDDHLMQITHVIRAEEWISSTPKHILLYEAFGWRIPQFAHLPLLRNSDRSKISKRKNPVSLNYYRRKGILPTAMVNYLSTMGWSFGEDREIFSPDEMQERFSFKDIHLGGPIFDIQKLCHLNQHYIKKMSPTHFSQYLRSEIYTEEFLQKLHGVLHDRIEAFEQFAEKSSFFFNGELSYKDVQVIPKGKNASEVKKMLREFIIKIEELFDWSAANIQALMNQHREEINWKPRDYFMTIRILVTGRKDSPPLAESLELVGREMVSYRLRSVSKSNIFQ